MFGDGSECPNQAYVSNWKAINLRTGKAVVEEDFVNLHWDIDKNTHVSNSVSNADSNTEPVSVFDDNEGQGEQEVNSDFDWDEGIQYCEWNANI